MRPLRSVCFFLLSVFLFSCKISQSPQTEFALATFCTVNLYEKGSGKRYAAVFARIREIDRMMSAYQTDSAVDRINRNAGLEPVPVPEELITVLEKAFHYAELSGGAFDPTVGPLVRLWGIGTEAERVPEKEEIAAVLDLTDYRDLVIDREAGTAFLRRRGMALDLGAIAKGYAGDEAIRVIQEAGIKRALADLGGNIIVLGSRRGNRPWRVGVQDPRRERGSYIGVLQVRDKSVVTSGVYERFFEAGGRRYHHILSTETGYPVETGLLSVTIVADCSTAADGLSTAVFALGYEKGRALIEALPGTEAVFIFENLSVRITGGLTDNFSLVSEEYRLE